jgi:N-acetylgalactosamine-N,N'-diacetylbacillosaminyl-diphospho-undecaprenol 4-alpha-N-acetylgalactosaminyltransferase
LTQKSHRLKICFVTVTLSDGGAERCAALLSNYFDSQNVEVYHVVFSGKVDYDYSGKLFHLEHLKDKRNSWWSRSKRFFSLKQKRLEKNWLGILNNLVITLQNPQT